MDYEKKYKESIGRAKKELDACGSQDCDAARQVFRLFPELKESDDEKIRESLLEYLHTLPNHYAHSGVCAPEWIAWIEKQSEQKLCVNDNAKEMFIKALERVEEQNNKGYKLTDCDKNSWWEDFKAYTSCTIVQKPADKVEPKFKVGDWLFHEGSDNALHISRIMNHIYVSDEGATISFSRQNNWRLWTIQDAKDGDILYTPKGLGVEGIFLVSGWQQIEGTGKTLCSNIGYRVDDDEIVEGGIGAIWWKGVKDPFFPATKEQRNTLMKAMADAGYTFDFEKKELKKIEDEEYNGEDYGIDSLYHAQRILEKTLGSVDGYQTDDGILSHKCAITAVKKLYEQKPAEWSEEDKDAMDMAIIALDDMYDPDEPINTYAGYSMPFNKAAERLKSLKDRYTWKPSEEQMLALEASLTMPPQSPAMTSALIELYQNLKKLREE